MIRRLGEEDHQACFQLIKTRPAENLFIIGDIEAYGYDQPFQRVWGEFNQHNELIAVLLKYEGSYIPFSKEEFSAVEFAEIINADHEFLHLSGLEEIAEKIEPYINRKLKKKRLMHYAKCTKLTEAGNSVDTSNVESAELADIKEIVKLLKEIPEFSDTHLTVANKERERERGVARSFYIYEDGKFVSTASTTAENAFSAMIVAVGTLEAYKGKGYATKCMVKLCNELFSEGKELCLLYDNPNAGNIYRRIGFKEIGFWTISSYIKER